MVEKVGCGVEIGTGLGLLKKLGGEEAKEGAIVGCKRFPQIPVRQQSQMNTAKPSRTKLYLLWN